jgi:hypothetical protein
MADTAPALDQRMELERIRRPLYGWVGVAYCAPDPRLHILIRRTRLADANRWFFGVILEPNVPDHQRWGFRRGQLDHRAGPFAAWAEAEAEARRWFLDNPAGAVAELLARQPHNPHIRPLLLALNGGDPTAGKALADLCEEAGIPQPLFNNARVQLIGIGVWPFPTNERYPGDEVGYPGDVAS